MSNVVSGSPMPGLTRFSVAARSPLTGAFGEAEAGGFWCPELKKAGFDGVIIKGRSVNPVYLWIKDSKAEIRGASHLWGKDASTVQRMIREELSDRLIRVLQCGPAGENQVPYACVVNELKHVAGRTGMGAVMGSKNLRAIAVKGGKKISTAYPDRVQDISRRALNRFSKSPMGIQLKRFGTSMCVMGLQQAGILPTHNFQKGRFEGAKAISGEALEKSILKGTKGCYSCPIQCKRTVEIKGTYSARPEYGGPEYETLGALGSLCGIDNLEAISHGNELCNRWGLDTISTGVCIAFAMECNERGILSKNEMDGIDLRFGNADGMIQMIHKIAFLEGFGNLLAKGVKRAAREIGNGCEKYAMHVKGQEVAVHEPRGKYGVAFSYAVSPTGADHIEAPHDTSFVADNLFLESIEPIGEFEPMPSTEMSTRKVRQFLHTQQVYSFFNSLGICNFSAIPCSAYTLPMIAELLEAITGWKTSLFELMELGERGITMARMFNLREGFTAKDDILPVRFFEPLDSGSSGEKNIDPKAFKSGLKLYYQALGWDAQNGVPGEGRLAYLGLDWLLEDG